MSRESVIYIKYHADGKIIGCATGAVVDGVATLDNIQIEPRYRGKGHGSKLLQQFLAEARQRGATTINGTMLTEYRLNEAETRAFYQKHGIEVDRHGNLKGRLSQ